MNIKDFEYDGRLASDFDLIVCSTNGGKSGTEVMPSGAEINFNQVSLQGGRRWLTTDCTYDNPLETTFQVCKYDCKSRVLTTLDILEQREITRWLNRNEDHKCRFITNDTSYNYVNFEGKFNLSKIETTKGIIGYELHFITNRPYAIGSDIRKTFNLSANGSFIFKDPSDEVGYIYPTLTIKCLADGDLTLHNSIEDRYTIIKNCSANEVITFHPFLQYETSLSSHKLQNDFNFKFFRIANKYDDRKNIITSSLPCEITFEYSPIIKGVGL